MQRSWKNKIKGVLEMIPPLRGGDFQGIAGLSSDDSLLVGVSTARERSFNKTPALSNIGSMSPARLSLSTVASPHCRLLFHLAGGILTAKQRRLSGAAQNQASVIAHRGLEVKLLLSTSGRGRNIFLDFPSPETYLSRIQWIKQSGLRPPLTGNRVGPLSCVR